MLDGADSAETFDTSVGHTSFANVAQSVGEDISSYRLPSKTYPGFVSHHSSPGANSTLTADLA